MNGKIKGMLLFVLGLVVGGAGSFLYMAVQYNKVLALWHGASVMEMAVDARQIRLGRQDEVLQRIDTALPRVAMDYATLFRSSPGYTGTLWPVRRYYSEHPDLPVPADLRAVLAALPQRLPSSCEIGVAGAAASQPAEAPAIAPAGQ